MKIIHVQLLIFATSIAGAIVGSVFHATTAIVLSCILFFTAFTVGQVEP